MSDATNSGSINKTNTTNITDTTNTSAGSARIEDYFWYPKNFKSYRWFRPLLVSILTVVFYVLVSNGATIILQFLGNVTGNDVAGTLKGLAGGYDNFDSYSTFGALLSLGLIALLIVALALGNLVAGKRPFSSYISSKGGWRMKVFFICLGVALVVSALPVGVSTLMDADTKGAVKFTVAGFIFCIILGPFQCIAEEFIFRALATQTLTGWFRIRILAVILSSLFFMVMHPYNGIGKIEIFITGAAMCLMAWIANGIEASSAIHITNNMTIFIMTGFGISKVTEDAKVSSIILSTVIDIVYIVILILIKKKTNIFDEVKKDDVAEYNHKFEEKLAGKK